MTENNENSKSRTGPSASLNDFSCVPLYTIASETHEIYGHGDSGIEFRICKEGSYGTGEFPPVFEDRNLAQDYLNKIESWRRINKRLVKLKLYRKA